MQYAKDTFYITLRNRLATVNPQRTVVLDGVARPAIYVAENEVAAFAAPPAECFAITFGAARPIASTLAAPRPMLSMDGAIAYRTAGASANLNSDRGRTLATLDLELLQICAPQSTAKMNYTVTPAADLLTKILWLRPQFAPVEAVGSELRRVATTTLFFYPEVDF